MNLLLSGSLDAAETTEWLAALQAALPGHHIHADRHALPAGVALADIAVAIVANPPPGSLQGLPGLRLVQSLWAGVDRLLADTTLPPGVPLARMVDPAMNQAMAETALWATLALHRGFFTYARHQAAACWQPHGQRRADELQVLVLGWGQMGRTAARTLARQGYRVAAWRRAAAEPGGATAVAATDDAGIQVLHGPPALAGALPQADVVVNLLPLTPHTRGLVDAAFLAAMKPGAGLVNLARGAHVVEADLLAALDRGHLGHAVLDVFSTEPLPPEHPFWRHPRVTVLPHAAAQTDPRSAAAVVARNIEALAAGRPLQHLVARDAGY